MNNLCILPDGQEGDCEPCNHEYFSYVRTKHPIMDIIEYCPKCQTVKKKLPQLKPLRERNLVELSSLYLKDTDTLDLLALSYRLNRMIDHLKFLEENK